MDKNSAALGKSGRNSRMHTPKERTRSVRIQQTEQNKLEKSPESLEEDQSL